MNKTFENYLQMEHAKKHANGVLDDDMPDHFDNWISQLDPQEIIGFAEAWGKTIRTKTEKEQLDEHYKSEGLRQLS